MNKTRQGCEYCEKKDEKPEEVLLRFARYALSWAIGSCLLKVPKNK